jgi:hypothetical protein
MIPLRNYFLNMELFVSTSLIDDCRDLISKAEQSWSQHHLYSHPRPTSRHGVVACWKTAGTMRTGIFIDLWPLVLVSVTVAGLNQKEAAAMSY